MNTFSKKLERDRIHSHVLKKDTLDLLNQKNYKEALLNIVNLLKLNKPGQTFLIRGPSGCGKTALIADLYKEQYLINSISAVELQSFNLSKAEAVTQAVRKSIRLRIKEIIKVIEGEITNLTSSKLSLKTLDMESTFEIGDKMLQEIQKEKIVIGDVVRIIKERGKIIKLGISASKMDSEFIGDILSVPCPEGEMFKTIEDVQLMTLHDIDCLNNKTHGYLEIYNGETGEISSEVRKEVNKRVKKWILEEKVVLERGLLIIDNVQILHKDYFYLFNNSIEFTFDPVILMIENVTDTLQSSTGLLSSAFVINVDQINDNDLKDVIRAHIETENVDFDSNVLDYLNDLALSYGINYAINIIDLYVVKSLKQANTKIALEEVKTLVSLFLDVNRACDTN
ncbi:ruvb-like 2-like protein [Vairimorpha ceranae]|uniref:RuvB-like helicase n=1 Tax=Vairimorpha ceranae TaxID=40302 RepID=A0A0F9ZAB0_9MICR|nr:ruvb-like 2-like protein [Vairimorpha ceranae]KAF5140620.1 hypothetical protein G9O61_00g011160 [Vairimorpha ceranae]KKO74759.1 ruvb-like 2-like protein [Vairimorpha ceranae]